MSINKSSVNRNDSDRFEAHAPVGNVAKPKNWQKTADAPRGKKVKVRAVKARTASAKSVEKAPEKKPEPVKSVEKVPEKKAEPVKSVEKVPGEKSETIKIEEEIVVKPLVQKHEIVKSGSRLPAKAAAAVEPIVQKQKIAVDTTAVKTIPEPVKKPALEISLAHTRKVWVRSRLTTSITWLSTRTERL